MLKKFLAFIGLTSVKLEDGKATLEITEEQMEASGKIIDERDHAIAEKAKLAKELEEERQQNVTAQDLLKKANEEIARLKAENEELKLEPGAVKLETKKGTDGGEDKSIVVSKDDSFEENYARVMEKWY